MDHYRTLGLSVDATKAEIKEAFRRSALEFHPDKHGKSSPEIRDGAAHRFRLASEAYEVLADDHRRAEYDLRRRLGWRGGTHHSSSSSSHYHGGRAGGYRGPPPPRDYGGRGFDLAFVFRFLTRRRFLVNVAFASALLGGAVVFERSIETIWNMNNSGKSFEEAIESIEKVKIQKEDS